MRGGKPQKENNRLKKGGVNMEKYLTYHELELKLQAIKSTVRVDIPNLEQTIDQLKYASDPSVVYGVSSPRIKSEDEAKYNSSPNPYVVEKTQMLIEQRDNIISELSFFQQVLDEKKNYVAWWKKQIGLALDEREVEMIWQRYVYERPLESIAFHFGYSAAGSARRSIERMLTSRVKIERMEVLRLKY